MFTAWAGETVNTTGHGGASSEPLSASSSASPSASGSVSPPPLHRQHTLSSTGTRSPVRSQSPAPSTGASSSPQHSPFTTPHRPSLLSMPTMQHAPGPTPWHILAAMSGAPTPASEVPSGSRGSPQLGYPFEQLTLGSRLDGSASPSNRSSPPQFARHGVPSGAIAGTKERSPLAGSLAQRRAAAQQSMALPSSPLGSDSASRLKPLNVDALPRLAAAGTTLILDIRPPSAFQASHVPTAHSLSVPSTLLRRPAFGLTKLGQMMAAPSQEALSHWRDMSDIVFVDQDSLTVPDGNVLQGLTNKFTREGFGGKLWFVCGGHSAIIASKQCDVVADDDMEDDAVGGAEEQASGQRALDIGRLSKLAFQQASTVSARGSRDSTVAAPARADPFDSTDVASSSTSSRRSRPTELPSNRLQPANPFFDNIRQNLELSHGGITERIPLALPEEISRRADELPAFLRNLVKMPQKDSMDLLAQQFYKVELGEQKRLQSVMDFLARDDNGQPTRSALADEPKNAVEVEQLMEEDATGAGYFPFSITAGVERGTKNRYKNIWPYDFARVRLGDLAEGDSDYINASFVQPRGTTRRYIATQGPLDATYRDFWTLVWEQNVHVIVMITKQFEGGLQKCGNYWAEQQYGDLHLKLQSQSGGDDKVEQAPTGFDFGPAAQTPRSAPGGSGNIIRVFDLWHSKHPAPRKVTQVQCVDWPDFDVPDSPEVLMQLMRDVDTAVEDMCALQGGEDRCDHPPVLVHCSAGIGRTGSYILVDAITDGLRRERRASASRAADAAKMGPSDVGASADSGAIASTRDRMELDSPHTPTAARDGLGPVRPLPGRRASSSENTPDIENPRPVTQSHIRHRLPTPLTSMSDPIVQVLRGMRVQRMSLVQSLRQYLFVHRAIITHYLQMVDEERERQRSKVADPKSGISGVTSAGIEDEAHYKRKPDVTDLPSEADIRLQSGSVDSLRLEDHAGGSGLAKRASFKKRRGANEDRKVRKAAD